MPRKISDETKQLIGELYAQDLPINEIARRANVSYPTAYGYTKLRQKVNPETGQLFKSLSQYQEYITRQRVNPETGQLFKSLSQYQEYTARQRVNPETGQLFESLNQLMDYRTRQKVNPETGQLFESLSQYQEYTARQSVNRPENQGLSKLIIRRLKELGKNQSWLADEIGVTRQAVSLYVKGRFIPTDDSLKRLYSSLDVPYETLDDLLKDIDIE